MTDAKTKLADVLREAIVWLSRPGNDFAWSSWDDAGEAVAELSAHVATLEAGTLPSKLDLTVLFAPTGPIQEVSISSGWARRFLIWLGGSTTPSALLIDEVCSRPFSSRLGE
jgi:hypothetical protein